MVNDLAFILSHAKNAWFVVGSGGASSVVMAAGEGEDERNEAGEILRTFSCVVVPLRRERGNGSS